MQKETRLFRKLVRRFAGLEPKRAEEPDVVFRAFGEGVVRRLAEPPAPARPTRGGRRGRAA